MSDHYQPESDHDDEFLPEPSPTPTPFEVSEGDHATFLGVPDTTAELSEGSRLADQFEIIRVIGKGGVGVVYEVTDLLTRQRLALKAVWPSLLANPRAVEAFAREVNVARRLRHPGIVAIYDIRQMESFLFYTMEYLDGKTVATLLLMRKRFPLMEAVGVLYRICRILEYAHKHTVHRGVYPENIIVTRDRRLKILDFGIHQATHLCEETLDPAHLEKAFFKAPELAKNPLLADPRTDVYSLGIFFFKMLSGEYPRGYARLGDACPDLPPAYEALVETALGTMDERFQTVRAFRKALENCSKT